MKHQRSASQRFGHLHGKRQGLLKRCEDYAYWTLRKIFPEASYDQNNEEHSHDNQSVGAQAVNHLSNKLMLALFAPSRPCMRLEASPRAKQTLEQVVPSGTPERVAAEAEIQKELANIEKEATKLLDKRKLRPKLYEVLKHLIITGNVLLVIEKDTIRVMSLRKYVVRRNRKGEVIELIIKEELLFDELDDNVQSYLASTKRHDDKVCLYRVVRRMPNGDYEETQWVDDTMLPEDFSGKYPKDKLPYRPLTWDLADDQDYGTGLVEDYANDFSALSKLSNSQVTNAILASEFRWLANPAGVTSVAEFANSANGDVLAGNKDDLTLVESSKRGDMQVVGAMVSEYVNRIGRGFLLASMLVRQAERVTAEEIRQTAQELETALGGAYSRIAVDFQEPLAEWLISSINANALSDFDITIITGMDALSRAGDLDDLKLWLADLTALANIPPQLQATLNMSAVATALALPRRIDSSLYLKSQEQIAAEQQAAQEQAAQAAMVQAGAQQAASTPMPQEGQP